MVGRRSLARRFGWLRTAYVISTVGTWLAFDVLALIAILVLHAGHVARLSPLKHANLSVLGRYNFRASTPAGSGATKQRQGVHPLLATLNV